tara:strand:- start:198 stop:545 length:348 start_codon:yes stop_codon:yes gene_type:complete
MCVNDLIVQGAKPIFFLDYIAIDKLKLDKVKKILDGIVSGCKLSDCALIGGETAEMPGTYGKNKFDLERVLKNREKYSGCTVHFVTSKLDSGKIISQKKVLIDGNETEKSLKKKY